MDHGRVPAVESVEVTELVDELIQVLADRIIHWREFVDFRHELEIAKNEGLTILCRTDDEYPDSLRSLGNPPLCIYLLGTLPVAPAVRSIAIVGTRMPSEFGIRKAREFSMFAVREGWSTVSGLASGIDTAVHRSAVEAGGKTVSVLGSGIANVYPPENIGLARATVRSGGAVVSEYPMNTGANRYTLPRRNRIIAGLSCCTLMIEAAERSGALMTAAYAAERGCRVFAVQGEAANPLAAGCNNLIRQGAKPAMSFKDILDRV